MSIRVFYVVKQQMWNHETNTPSARQHDTYVLLLSLYIAQMLHLLFLSFGFTLK